MSDDIKDTSDMLKDLEKQALEVTIPRDIEKLQFEVVRLRKILEQYGISDEMHLTNIEFICQKAIDDLKIISVNGELSLEDTKKFDFIHKNLRAARGNLEKKELPGKKSSEAELLRIVNSDKKQSK
jgi:hypothetical protein